MESSIAAFSQSIQTNWDGTKPPVAYSTHVGNANSSLGSELLDPNRTIALGLEMDGYKALGVKAISISVDYPALDPAFDAFGGRSSQYLNFYKGLMVAARTRGLKVVVETGPMFSDPAFSSVDVMPFYNTLTIEQYRAGRANHALLIAQELAPDFLSVIQEPDTEATQTGKPELGTPDGSAALLNQIMMTYRNAGISVPVGAGVGTWIASYTSYIQNFVNTSIDFVDMHIYPSNRDYLQRAVTIADMARAAGKQVGMSEAWSHKVRDSELAVVSPSVIFGRDVFSFWAPIDSLFLKTMVDFAHFKNLLFLGAFQGALFRNYLEYTPQTAEMTPAELNAAVLVPQTSAMLAGGFTSTGEDWMKYILSDPDTAAPTAPPAGEVTPYPTSVVINWSESSDNVGVAGYEIHRDDENITRTTSLAYYDNSLTDGKTYKFSIMAFDASGNLSSPTEIEVTTKDVTPPDPPATVVAETTAEDQITITWAAATDNVKVESYWLLRGVDGKTPTAFTSLPGTATSYVNTNLQSTASFCYALIAMDSAGMPSETSPKACASTPDITAPTIPTNLTGNVVSANQITLSWTASTDKGGVALYRIYRGDNGSPIVAIGTSTTPAYVDRTATSKVTYNYRIAACDAIPNCSGLSAGVRLTTPAAADTTPPATAIYAPLAGSTVSRSVALVATATDLPGTGEEASGIAGVRIQVDGMDVAAEVTAKPYYVVLNTKNVSNGAHTVTAIGRDIAGNVSTSAPAVINVAN